MSEIVPIVATGIVGALSGVIGTTFIAKHMMSDEKIAEKFDNLLSEVTQNVEMQKKIYVVGGLIGKGIRDGTGLSNIIQKKRGGLEGIISDLIGNFIGARIGASQQPQQQPEQTQIEAKW